MGITRKRGATTAQQANLPEKVDKRHQFWTIPFPYGILGVHLHEIIDFDQAAIFQRQLIEDTEMLNWEEFE